MNPLRKLFQPSATQTEILFTRTCFVGGVEYLEGARASFDRKTAGELMASGKARNPEAEATAATKAERLADLLPPPFQPSPLPESWKALPACFSQWWALSEARAALVTRMDAIEANLMAVYKNNPPPNFKGAESLPPADRNKLLTLHVGHESNMDNEAANYLKDALQRAKETVEEWQAANLPALVKAQLECSSHTQQRHGELCRNIRELHGLGFELFAIRLAALGLHESQVERLYQGSADFQKYGTITAPMLQDLKLAWVDETGPTYYVAQSPRTLVSILAGYAATAAQVEALTKQADKELAAAKRVASKAA